MAMIKNCTLGRFYVLMLKVPQTLKRYLVLPFVVRVLFIIYWLRGRGKGGDDRLEFQSPNANIFSVNGINDINTRYCLPTTLPLLV